jgi:uncharacterized membrane protein YraQ (UPF0718 family)
MNSILDYTSHLIFQTFNQTWLSFQHNWYFLLASIVIAAMLKRYLNAGQVSTFLGRHRRAGVAAATAVAVGTPLCSCGTVAVILGMMASQMSWAPIVAFMVASPLTSPGELIYSAGLFGWPFALAFFLASILLGLLGGFAASLLESRGWLAGQARFDGTRSTKANPVEVLTPGLNPECSGCREQERALVPGFAASKISSSNLISLSALPEDMCCAAAIPFEAIPTLERPRAWKPQIDARMLGILDEIWRTGIRLVTIFFAFAFVGYLLNGLIPSEWVAALFGSGRVYGVPLAATLGLPFYLNTEASLPMVRGLLEAGMSQGAALAFMISGAGTSLGAIAGALTIARWRIVGLVFGTLWTGAILIGAGYDLLLSLGLF